MTSTKRKIKFCDSTDTLTVRQLIADLQLCENQDAPVLAWLLDADEDGTPYEYDPMGRYIIGSVDDTYDQHRLVELNIHGLPAERK